MRCHRRLPRRRERRPNSSQRPSASAASTIAVLTGKREAKYSALGVVSGLYRAGRHRRRSRRRFARTGRRARASRAQRRDAAAWQSCAAGPVREVGQEGREDRAQDAQRRAAAQARRGPHLLCGRRNVARAGAAAHVADRLSAACDARLRHPGARGAGVFAPGASGEPRDALAHRNGQRGAPSAACLCGAGARARRAHHATRGDRDLGARRARRPALFGTVRAGARQGRPDRGRAGPQSAALALAGAWRGTDPLDRPLHGVLRSR